VEEIRVATVAVTAAVEEVVLVEEAAPMGAGGGC
jgi:hypothetical protein